MSERYTKLFSLTDNLYAEGSPVVLSAGNLLKDTQTGKVLAQLKIKNLDGKTVKAAKVLLHPQDTSGKPLNEDVEQEYLDLQAKQGEEFGQRAPVPLPNASTRAFSAEVTQIIFADNSVWEAAGAVWEPLPESESLEKALGDNELIKQYKIRYGCDSKAAPRQHKDLWLCACGAWNKAETCYKCSKSQKSLLSLDLNELTAEKDARLTKEQAAKEAAEKKAEAAAKKTKKIVAIVAPVVIVCLAAVLLTTKVFIPNSNYNEAVALLNAGQYDEAIAAFEALGGYKDSPEQAELSKEAKREAENTAAYADAEALLVAGDYDAAITAFNKLGNYRDSAQKADEAADLAEEKAKANAYADAYADAEALVAEGKTYEAAVAFYSLKGYEDAWERCFELWGEITNREYISTYGLLTAGLRSDGTVMIVGYKSAEHRNIVSKWTDIVAISEGSSHTVGLQADGTVIAAGSNNDEQCDVYRWKDVVAISAGNSHTVGLQANGRVVAVGKKFDGQCDVSYWSDIVSIAAGWKHTVGLCADGTVVAVGAKYDAYGQCDVSDWTDIVAIAAGGSHTVGLRADGTVVTVGSNKYGQRNVAGWEDIVAVSARNNQTIGLRADGTVVAAGYNDDGQCDVSDWMNIVAIAVGSNHTVGLREDGTVVAAGSNNYGQSNVSDWTDIKLP